MNKPILCVDFDGVIHSYESGWQGADVVADGPVPGAIDFLSRATDHFDVCIYSSRSSQPGGREAMGGALARWIKEWAETAPEGLTPPVVRMAAEKPAAFLTIDDRAVCFEGDFAALDPAKLAAFKPWNKRAATVEKRPLGTP